LLIIYRQRNRLIKEICGPSNCHSSPLLHFSALLDVTSVIQSSNPKPRRSVFSRRFLLFVALASAAQTLSAPQIVLVEILKQAVKCVLLREIILYPLSEWKFRRFTSATVALPVHPERCMQRTSPNCYDSGGERGSLSFGCGFWKSLRKQRFISDATVR
jgi:hypothetical protein